MVSHVVPAERRVRAGELELAIREWNGAGRDFVLVHGLASNARTWDLVAQRLSGAGYHVVSIDQRGHGQSDKPDAGYGFDEVTRDLAALIEAMGLEHPIVAGQSWGGNVAVDFASRYPGMSAGLILVDGGLIDLSQRPGATWETISQDLRPPDTSWLQTSDVEKVIRGFHPNWNDEQVALQMACYETLENGTVRPWLSLEHHLEILWALWNQRPSQLLESLELPVMIAIAQSGLADRRLVRVEEAEHLQSLRPDRVRWHEFIDAAHDIHIDQPEELSAWILEAMDEGFFG